jgi:acyl carrier protein
MQLIDIKEELLDIFERITCIEKSKIDADENIMNLGIDSVLSLDIVMEVNTKFGTDLLSGMIYDYPTINKFSAYIHQELQKK